MRYSVTSVLLALGVSTALVDARLGVRRYVRVPNNQPKAAERFLETTDKDHDYDKDEKNRITPEFRWTFRRVDWLSFAQLADTDQIMIDLSSDLYKQLVKKQKEKYAKKEQEDKSED